MKYLDKLRSPRLSPYVLILVGAILMLWPDVGTAAVSAVLGWILVAVGAVMLFIGILSWRSFGIGLGAAGVVLLFSGIWLNNNPLALAKILGILCGAMILVQGLNSLMDARRVRKAGGLSGFSCIVGILTVLLGLFLILSPLSTSRFVMVITGVILILCGVSNLVSHKRVDRYIHEHGDIIDSE